MAMSFHHPYEPYDIQLQLMRCVYGALTEGKKLAVVESPTGTGKTLSLICSVVTWLRENKATFVARGGGRSIEDDEDDEDEPEWVRESFLGSVLSGQVELVNEYEAHLKRLRAKSVVGGEIRSSKRRKVNHVKVAIEEGDFLPGEYHDADVAATHDALGMEVKAMLTRLEGGAAAHNYFDIDSLNPVKIYFASRTHSQLSQFASQLKLPRFPSSFSSTEVESIKCLPLGSRKQLCINPQVNRWKSAEAINEACGELLRAKGCQFKAPANNVEFRDHVFTDINDIEDLASLGERLGVCPYYASRDSIRSAEIITLPYQYLLLQSTREALGLDMKNAVVIIDEAHNLIDTINSIHSSEISLQELVACRKGLGVYLNKFKSRLGPGNRVNLMKLAKLIDTLVVFIRQHYKKPGQTIDPNEILGGNNSDTLNVHKINRYIKVSKIAYKLDSYIQSLNGADVAHSQPLLFKIASFIKCLQYPAEEGRFFFEKGHSIKYMLLQPDKCFQSILEDSKCVLLAGGTMQPVSHLVETLFPKLSSNEIVNFSCDHVIPDDNLQTYLVQEPDFQLTFEKRQNPRLIENMFDFYFQLSQVVPVTGGIVGFFPSYQYLKFVIDSWRKSGSLDRLLKLRKVFYESKDGAEPLEGYTKAIMEEQGAILFAVVGGKLSEGINFQDNLCRAVVMTGMPFPNVFSGEMLVKKNYLESKILRHGGSREEATSAVREFFETICLKAVNQSVGRAIRHANDYANIYLLDKRYSNTNIRDKLSHWVSKRVQSQHDLKSIMKNTKTFFSSKEH
ncbi:CHL1 (YPL008W) [Zygosaccharomyces parabailii]|nr:CHL1 (YPL008W) [Zygosaccharomyces parabailii]